MRLISTINIRRACRRISPVSVFLRMQSISASAAAAAGARDDSFPTGDRIAEGRRYSDPYTWTPDADITLQDFLTQYKPSTMRQSEIRPPDWLSLRLPKPFTKLEDEKVLAAVREAGEYLNEVTGKIRMITMGPRKEDTDVKNRNEMRKKIRVEAMEKLKEIAFRHGYISGRWTVTCPVHKIDDTWSKVATSLAAGPLFGTQIHTAQVSTFERQIGTRAWHLLVFHAHDVFDKGHAYKTMRVLIGRHGLTLNGSKPDLYTRIGLNTERLSGISPTIWQTSELLSEEDIKYLRSEFEYYARLDWDEAKRVEAERAEATDIRSRKRRLPSQASNGKNKRV